MTDRWFPDAMPRPVVNAHTAGFFEAAREHRLVVRRCRSCGAHHHPPRPLCPFCRSFDLEWDEVSGRGSLFTWTAVHQALHPALRELVPYVVAVVELDGTGGTRMTSNLVDWEPRHLTAGQPVELVWEDMDPRLTLPRFRPA
jgi:uncharacterized OB-fold protein